MDFEGAIPFSLLQEEASVKLVELPDELLALLTGENPPTLCFKSKGSPADEGGAQSPGFAVLCTENKTFQIHQQQTSNPIFVIQPTSAALPGHPDGICALSTCSSTLGLSLNTGEFNAAAHLRDLLDLWTGVMGQKGGQAMSKIDVYENIPLSKNEIDAEWKRSCAFELSGRCYVPNAQVLLSSWKAIIDASRAEGIDMLDESRQEVLWDAVSDEGIPKDLCLAMLARLNDTDAETWVAAFMLEANGGSFSRPQFVESWKDLLPEKMGSNASMDMVKDFCDLSDPTLVSLKGMQVNTGKGPAASKPSSKARNWHERLKKGR